jgi:hypothetical protein
MRMLFALPLSLALATPSAPRAESLISPPSFAPHPVHTELLIRHKAADPAALCESAIITAEASNRLPARLLQAISLTESGRIDPALGYVRPWPWTINAEGTGQFFETKQQAVAAVKMLQARGVQSIDVGCLQVNLLHHPAAFASLEDAFDPRLNAAYAARFLNVLYNAHQAWSQAIAAYHSDTPALGEAYRKLVMARWPNATVYAMAPANTAYGDFAGSNRAYAAFGPASRVYGAFAVRP